jgi:hypothetical protein
LYLGKAHGDILYSFCQEKKVKKNKIFKNNELKIDLLFRDTFPSNSVHGFNSGDVVDFVDFLFFNREGVKNAKGVFVGFPI